MISPVQFPSAVTDQKKQSPGSTMTADRMQITTLTRTRWRSTYTPHGPSRSGRRSVSRTWSKWPTNQRMPDMPFVTTATNE